MTIWLLKCPAHFGVEAAKCCLIHPAYRIKFLIPLDFSTSSLPSRGAGFHCAISIFVPLCARIFRHGGTSVPALFVCSGHLQAGTLIAAAAALRQRRDPSFSAVDSTLSCALGCLCSTCFVVCVCEFPCSLSTHSRSRAHAHICP